MQSIEILIVIVLIQYHAPTLLGQAAARGGPLADRVDAIQNDGVQKRIAADDKEKAMLRELST
ncbi:MAG: hypothetical protein V4462_02120 [Pseudomonadota bacterium]